MISVWNDQLANIPFSCEQKMFNAKLTMHNVQGKINPDQAHEADLLSCEQTPAHVRYHPSTHNRHPV